MVEILHGQSPCRDQEVAPTEDSSNNIQFHKIYIMAYHLLVLVLF